MSRIQSAYSAGQDLMDKAIAGTDVNGHPISNDEARNQHMIGMDMREAMNREAIDRYGVSLDWLPQAEEPELEIPQEFRDKLIALETQLIQELYRI